MANIRLVDETDKFATNMSLCWHCSRATDSSCSWSGDFIPVDGWVAEKSVSSAHYGKDSYLVKSCPLFARYNTAEITDIGMVRMIRAVMTRAGKDYLKYLKHEKMLRQKDAGLSTKRILYQGKWRKLYGYEMIRTELTSLEWWLTSEYAMMFDDYVDPIWLMESIRKEVGI